MDKLWQYEKANQFERDPLNNANDTTAALDSLDIDQSRRRRHRGLLTYILIVSTLVLSLTNIFTFYRLHNSEARCQLRPNISPYTGIDRTKQSRIEGYWTPEYMSKNKTEADELWDRVNLGHGVVLLDPHHAVNEIGIPPSREFNGKMVYAVAAYHAIHCVATVRKVFKSAYEGKKLSELQNFHVEHCLAVLREEIMCTADDTLLTVPYDENNRPIRTGFKQIRQCSNWEALRDWSTENSAGFITTLQQGEEVGWSFGTHYPPTDGWLISTRTFENYEAHPELETNLDDPFHQ